MENKKCHTIWICSFYEIGRGRTKAKATKRSFGSNESASIRYGTSQTTNYMPKGNINRVYFLPSFSFTNIHDRKDSRGRGDYFFNSPLPLPPASQILRHLLGDSCRDWRVFSPWNHQKNKLYDFFQGKYKLINSLKFFIVFQCFYC